MVTSGSPPNSGGRNLSSKFNPAQGVDARAIASCLPALPRTMIFVYNATLAYCFFKDILQHTSLWRAPS
jgi:hypothetical protein